MSSKNKEADELAKAAAQKTALPADVFFQSLSIKAIREEEDNVSHVLTITSEDWRSPIIAYLNGAFEPANKKETERMNARTKHYVIIASELFKSGIVAPLLKCISKEQGISSCPKCT